MAAFSLTCDNISIVSVDAGEERVYGFHPWEGGARLRAEARGGEGGIHEDEGVEARETKESCGESRGETGTQRTSHCKSCKGCGGCEAKGKKIKNRGMRFNVFSSSYLYKVVVVTTMMSSSSLQTVS